MTTQQKKRTRRRILIISACLLLAGRAAAQTFTNFVNGQALIPAGSFTMGNSIAADTDITDANPTNVYVSTLCMETNLVSYGEWQWVYAYATNGGYHFSHAGAGLAENQPVQSVDWYDCVKWCNARSQQEGLWPVYYTDAGLTQVYTNGEVTPCVNWTNTGWRLPTEAEWEKAARGGLSGQRFPWGDLISESLANYDGDTSRYAYDLGPNGYNTIYARGAANTTNTSPVGSFGANGYGLNDMAGNVMEWCWDWAGANYGIPSTNNPTGPASGSSRMYRGGSWSGEAFSCRTAYRSEGLPGGAEPDIGFRAVLANALPPVTTSNNCVPPPPGLIAWWPGNGNANDIIGINNGVLQGGVSFVNGLSGLAFSFDGTGTVVVSNCRALSFAPNAPMSVEVWVYYTAEGDLENLIGKGLDCGGNTSANYQLSFDYDSGDGLIFGGDSGIATAVDLPPNSWHHVVGTFDGDTNSIYLDGDLIGWLPGTMLGGESDSPLLIGGGGSCDMFQGMLQNVRIYDRALSADEVLSLFDAGNSGICTSPLPPVIVQPPAYTAVSAGATASFGVTISGNAPLACQWYLDGIPLLGATNTIYAITNVQTSNVGIYMLVVTNAYGTTNAIATLAIVNPTPTNILFSVTGNELTLSWPADHTGWRLQTQTNSPGGGIGTNWFDVANSQSTDQVVVPINTAAGGVFFRLICP